MGFLGALKAILGAIGAFFGWKQQKDLLDAGEAKGVAKANKKALDNVAKANRAANDPDTIDRLRGSRFRD
jgi:hypothetical protein